MIGYGVAVFAGIAVGLSLSDPLQARLLGWLTAWIGGAVLTIGLAYAWSRGLLLQGMMDSTGARLPRLGGLEGAVRAKSAEDEWLWTADLMAEKFDADLAADRAEQDADWGGLAQEGSTHRRRA
ncbi:MAG: hypothetical protein AAFR17_09045 [Pseudomonadota bacterium]